MSGRHMGGNGRVSPHDAAARVDGDLAPKSINLDGGSGGAQQKSSTVLSSAALHMIVDWMKHFFF